MFKRSKSKMNFGPITVMIGIGIVIALLSFLLNKLGVQTYITDPDTFETTIITVKNILVEKEYDLFLENQLVILDY